MSTSSEHSEISGQKVAKSPEQSTFSQTCSLLSQYLKENGSFGDLTLGMTSNTEGSGSPETTCQSATTMNLFPNPTKGSNMAPQNLTATNILSHLATYRAHLSAEENPNSGNSSVIKSVTKEPKAAQLTIFYDGQVLVFDDFPANKAKEIMSFASKGISQGQNRAAYTYSESQPSFPPNLVRNSADSSGPIHPNVTIVPDAGNNLIPDHTQAPSKSVVCDLPIARKASLHRFLEKRKDRIAARAPYQTSYPMAASKKPAESMSWLEMSAKSSQI